MGCGSSSSPSQATINEDSTDDKTSPAKKKQVANGKAAKKTLKEWFDETLVAPANHDEAYKPPAIPDHYMLEEVQFSNENVSEDQWKQPITSRDDTPDIQSDISWPYRKPSTKYSTPTDGCLTVDVDLPSGATRRQVIAVGGLYLGSTQSEALTQLRSIDRDSTHSVVLVGNLFDTLGVGSFHDVTSDMNVVLEKLEGCQEALSEIKALAEDGVCIYYMQGCRDAAVPVVAIERLLGDKVVHVQQPQLILSVNYGSKDSYRVRFTAGAQWDLLSAELPKDKQLLGRPIGHYVHRAAACRAFSVTPLIESLVRRLPRELEKDFAAVITRAPIQNTITERLLASALGLQGTELRETKCVVSEGKYIQAGTIIDYPYLRYLTETIGKEAVLESLKAMGGDYSSAFFKCQEDVCVSGLCDRSRLTKLKNSSKTEVIVANTGSWATDSPMMVRITFPKFGSNGRVELFSPGGSDNSKKAENGTTNGATPGVSEEKADESRGDTISIEDL